jgi:hypothetical protein
VLAATQRSATRGGALPRGTQPKRSGSQGTISWPDVGAIGGGTVESDCRDAVVGTEVLTPALGVSCSDDRLAMVAGGRRDWRMGVDMMAAKVVLVQGISWG